VRNPLHAIGLEAEMALEEGGSALPAPARRALGVILQGVERVEKITGNYLRLSRLSSGERTRFDATEALLSVLATYAAPCEAQGVRVDWKREGGGPFWIRADRDLLEQALGNLLHNSLQALEAVPKGERAIDWELRQLETGRVLLRVSDSGPGLAETVRARVFTPFVTTKAQGTGLGLSFVHRALQEQGGEARYAGAGPDGRGACFELLIPAAPEAAPAHAVERRVDDDVAL